MRTPGRLFLFLLLAALQSGCQDGAFSNRDAELGPTDIEVPLCQELSADAPACLTYETFLLHFPDAAGLTTQAERVSAQGLQRFIGACGITSPDALLPRLPAEYRAWFALMYDSRSLQESSPSHPRAILYGSDAQLLLSFNGHPEHEGYHSIEIIEWDAVNLRFVPHEIIFGASSAAQDTVCASQGLPAVAATATRNPLVCATCHAYGTGIRPNWDSYSMWPGAYGSATRSFHDAMHSHQTEAREYQSFLRNQARTGRYASLPLDRYPDDIDAIYDPTQPAHLSYTFNGGSPDVARQPNSQLFDLLVPLNAKRVAAAIDRSGSPATWAIYAASRRCMRRCEGLGDLDSRCALASETRLHVRDYFANPPDAETSLAAYHDFAADYLATGIGIADAKRMTLSGPNALYVEDARVLQTDALNQPWLIDPTYDFTNFTTPGFNYFLDWIPMFFIASRAGIPSRGITMDTSAELNLIAGITRNRQYFIDVLQATFEELHPEWASLSCGQLAEHSRQTLVW